MKRSSDRRRIPTDAASGDSRGEFGTLASLLNGAGPSPASPPAPETAGDTPPPSPGKSLLPTSFRPVLHVERRGHGGKTVTVLDAGALGEEMRRDLCRRLAAALGCGCRVEDIRILIQGDHRERARKWLESLRE